VLSGNYSSTEQVNSIQQLSATVLFLGLRLTYGRSFTDKKFGFLPPILSNSNFTNDPSKVTDIELTAHMIVVNNQKDSVSLPPLAAKPKKGKSHTPLDMDLTFMTFDEDVRAILISEDEARESKEDILGASKEIDDNPQSAETQHQSSPPQEDKPTSYTKAFDTDSSSDKILKKVEKLKLLTEERISVVYVEILARVSEASSIFLFMTIFPLIVNSTLIGSSRSGRTMDKALTSFL
nr:hypothetical protein [Tanacetum cinerariifolium]